MIKGKENTAWDSINNVEYISIPKPKYFVEEQDETVFMKSKKKSIELLGLTLLVFAAWLYYSIENLQVTYWSLFIGISILLFLIYLTYDFFKNEPVLILNSKGMMFSDTDLKWKEVTNMYASKQYTGDEDVYQLIIETKSNNVETINLDWLTIQPIDAIPKIGEYYWSWYEKQNPAS